MLSPKAQKDWEFEDINSFEKKVAFIEEFANKYLTEYLENKKK